jgi:hypothetical protein
VPAVARFDTPGSLRDLPAGHPFYDDWHTRVAGLIDSVRAGNPRGEFFDPSSWDFDQAGERRLTWMGLPRERMVVASRDDRRACFAACEDRNVQEEYIEWRAERRADGKITKVALVTETPEYWEELARADRARVMALYRQLVGPAATEAEVFSGPGGAYNRGNPWNTERGIVHYIQDINTLAAAVGLAQRSVDTPAQGSVNPGPPLDNFDIPTRAATSADPRVALDVAALARRGLSATLREPVGLYMAAWDDTGWTMPDGRPVGDYWTVRRGAPGAALRLEYRVPPSEGFVVGDIRIGGRPIEFGGQIAEHVTVTVGGVAGRRR